MQLPHSLRDGGESRRSVGGADFGPGDGGARGIADSAKDGATRLLSWAGYGQQGGKQNGQTDAREKHGVEAHHVEDWAGEIDNSRASGTMLPGSRQPSRGWLLLLHSKAVLEIIKRVDGVSSGFGTKVCRKEST